MSHNGDRRPARNDHTTTESPDDTYEILNQWDDTRLIETYRRLSHDLRQQGFDEQTVHRMGCVEQELRARALNPDEIAKAVEED